VNGFQEKTISQILSVFSFQTKSEITFFAISKRFGFISSAIIEYDKSKTKTISIQFFLIFLLVSFKFGFAIIKENKSIKTNKNDKNHLK
jgi:hypothetical protein